MCYNKLIYFLLTARNLVSIKPKPNYYVAVYSRKNKGCYRAKVIGPSSNDPAMFICTLIDFGYLDNIPSKYIFKLPDGYTKSKVRNNFPNKITIYRNHIIIQHNRVMSTK